MRPLPLLAMIGLLCLRAGAVQAQTADDIGKLIDRLVQLDSIDLADKGVKFRPGLEPSLHTLEADESKMIVLKNPYQPHGEGLPGAAGWYRVKFIVPEKLGKIPIPKGGYNLGIESNFRGAWEIYTYQNGKPAGLWSKDGMHSAANQPPTVWMSNAPMPTKAGDEIQVAILAMASPLGRGSPDGIAMRHLRLRFALAHTASRQPFYGGVVAPGMGTGLHGVRERLRTLQGDELKAFQEKVKGPLANIDAVFQAGETEKLNDLSAAMLKSSKELNEALKK